MLDPQIAPRADSLFYQNQQQLQNILKPEQNPQLDQDTKEKIRLLTQPQQNEKGFLKTLSQLCTIEYYQEYFDVTTDIIIQRVKNSLNPFSKTFFSISGGKPDFYGPFWILTTLIFTISFSANMNVYLQNNPEFQYKFDIVPLAALICYGKNILFPSIVKVLLKSCLSKQFLIIYECISIYGYSCTVQIFVFLLSCFPNSSIQWLLFLYGIFATTMFLISNFNDHINSELKKIPGNQPKLAIIGIIAAMQMALIITEKFKFFTLVENSNPLKINSNQIVKHLRNHP